MALKYSRQITIGGHQIQTLVEPNDFLVRLAKLMNWEEIFDRLKPFYSTIGRQALAIRLMIGLHILKHLSRLSDRDCVARLRGDIYWMHFCNTDFEQLNNFKHLNSSSMTKFRKRIGSEGFSIVEDIIRETLIKRRRLNPKVMTMDTSVQENNITHPTDSGLLDKGRRMMFGLIKDFKSLGFKASVKIRSYNRVCKKYLLNMIKLGKDRMDRIEEGTIELSKKAKYVLKKLSLFIEMGENKLKKLKKKGSDDIKKLNKLVVKARHYRRLMVRIIHQSVVRFQGRHVKNKVYSLHETQTVVIAKGKKPKTHEYGCKFNISIDSNGLIVSNEVAFNNKSDKGFVEQALKNWEERTGRLPEQLNADRGMWQNKKKRKGRVNKVSKICIPKKGKTKNPDHKEAWFIKGQKLRAGIEAVIGHLKQDHGVGKCRYRGTSGNKTNLKLACIAWNLKKWVRIEDKEQK